MKLGVEEFSIIINFPLYCRPIWLYISTNLSSLYSRFLGLDEEDMAIILLVDKVHFLAFVILKITVKLLMMCLRIGLPSYVSLGLSYL